MILAFGCHLNYWENLMIKQLKHTALKFTALSKSDADELLERCKQLTFTNQMGGRKIAQFGQDYTYSGVIHKGQDMPEWMFVLMQDINKWAGTEFNSVLVNHYPANTTVGIGMHSDNEPELGEDPIVVSLSLGASCLFKLASQHDWCDVNLHHGSICMMGKGCQRYYKHGIEKTYMQTDRISLTFRKFF